MPRERTSLVDLDFPATSREAQAARTLQEIFNVYQSSHLDTINSSSDKHILSRAQTRVSELLDAAQNLPAGSVPSASIPVMLDALRGLLSRLGELIDDAVDTTVTGYIQAVSEEAPRTGKGPDGRPKGPGGRPRKNIALSIIQDNRRHHLGPRYSAHQLSSLGLIKVSSRTFRRRALEAGEAQPGATFTQYTQISDDHLRSHVEDWMTEQPDIGITMLHGGLDSEGIRVQRDRLAKMLVEVRPERNTLHKKIYHRREEYWCAGPNSVWHHDGQHGLVNFGIVIHAFIDGYSRTVTCIRASTNNLAVTMLDVFLTGTAVYGTPSRVRGDRGGENVEVARHMFRVRGQGRGSYMWGCSPHNTRIERLWRDLTNKVGRKWKNFFLGLQQNHYLDTNAVGHKWLLAYLFLADINRALIKFQGQMNHRKVSGIARAHTPNQMFYSGMLKHGVRGLALADWKKSGIISQDGEDNVDPASYAAGGEPQDPNEPTQQPDELRDLDEQVRQQVEVYDPRCPFVHPHYEMEMSRRIWAQTFNRKEPSEKWEAALNAMEDMLKEGWGRH